ncbi:hypothetical protein D9758_011301 [Tetrapyrgos nigripes]|uniref:Uncharacterized protein n=1 Tax=Tetrapyrgos nigripes TaxID=182062 RepID=A0A8H5CST4_9AGAR|nr:hypothetical protein D9758_011301 [Tetrapyrgos nigripes]
MADTPLVITIPPLMTPAPSDESHAHGRSHSWSRSTPASPWVGPGSSLPPQGYHPSNQWGPSSPMPAQPGFIPPRRVRGRPSNVNVEFMGAYPNFAPTPFAGSASLPAGGGGMGGGYPEMTPFQAPISSPLSTPGMGMGGMGGMGMGTPAPESISTGCHCQ